MFAQSPRRLILFTRFPKPGESKTRMIPTMGKEGAANLQRRMTTWITHRTRLAARKTGAVLQVCYDGGDAAAFAEWLGPDLDYRPQEVGDLGHRMQAAFNAAFQEAAAATIILGSDIPGITPDHLSLAFEQLSSSDLVLGPTKDGGYYLIGMKRINPELFFSIHWGSEQVLATTLKRAEGLGLQTALLNPLEDIDRPEDLDVWNRILESEKTTGKDSLVSIIIPTLNESMTLGNTLAPLLTEPEVEVIIVDGGSSDGTQELALNLGAQVVISSPGRARQMNRGAATALGEILLFLHADTWVPSGFAHAIRTAMSLEGCIAGAFRFGLDSHSLWFSGIEYLTNLRALWGHEPYGDQGLFLKASTFHSIGGFPEEPILEDVILIRRLKKKGNIAILKERVETSVRRWQRLGIPKTFLFHRGAILAHRLGVTPETILRWFKRWGYFPQTPTAIIGRRSNLQGHPGPFSTERKREERARPKPSCSAFPKGPL